MEREQERLFEFLEEEENQRKWARGGEAPAAALAGASSSGGVVAQPEVPRSRGGVPLAPEAGGAVKRKSE